MDYSIKEIFKYVSLFIAVLLWMYGTFFIFLPYDWVCDFMKQLEIGNKIDPTCSIPPWGVFCIGIFFFICAYIFKNNFNFKKIFSN